MERWMIVYLLPLEVWMDIFCFPWITRKKFGQLVDKIGNFKFAELAQFYLHEWGKRTLGELYYDQNGLFRYFNHKRYHLKHPQTSMPKNIQTFDYIVISHFDANILDFLAKITQSLTDLEIDMAEMPCKYLDNLRVILANMAPLLDGTQSLWCCQLTLPLVRQCFSRGEFAQLKVLKYTHFGEANTQESVNTIMNWLIQPEQGDNNGPRLCEARLFDFNEMFVQISQAAREQFLASKNPRTFALNIYYRGRQQFADFHMKNGIGEELHGVWINGNGTFKNIQKAKHSRIQIYNPTIGSLNAAQMDKATVRVQEVHQQQPSTSTSKDA